MGKRLSKLYTKTGDSGFTTTATGDKLSKADPQIQAGGDVDELAAALALVVAGVSAITPSDEQSWLLEQLTMVQHRLFDLGSELTLPGFAWLAPSDTQALENLIDRLTDQLGALDNFILPGGSVLAAQTHLARAICRRAERTVAHLFEIKPQAGFNPESLIYLNRLSDALFICARFVNQLTGVSDVLWQQRDPVSTPQT